MCPVSVQHVKNVESICLYILTSILIGKKKKQHSPVVFIEQRSIYECDEAGSALYIFLATLLQ